MFSTIQKKYKADYDRIVNADMSYPVIMAKNMLIDGAHRVAKSFLNKDGYIKAYVLDAATFRKFRIAKVKEADTIITSDLIQRFMKNFCQKPKS